MADTFNFELVSPERLLVSEQVTEVVIPATLGEMTVLVNHAPTMTTIKPGVVSVKLASGQVEKYAVLGGFADILPTGCTLLAEAALPLQAMTREKLQSRIEHAQKELDNVDSDEHKTKLEQFLVDLTHLHNTVAAS